MKIFHVNASDIDGGAARATYRIHRSLLEHGSVHGLQSQMYAVSKSGDDHTVLTGSSDSLSGISKYLRVRLSRFARRGFSTANPSFHSLAWPPAGLGKDLFRISCLDNALLHLHWVGEFNGVGDVTLSIEEIGRLPGPLIWTLHDQWAFCGAEHYTSPPLQQETASDDQRFVIGYTPASRPASESGPDINRRTWLRKRRAWRRPIQIVCPSNWLADCARRSALMGEWPISVIPNPIDLEVWAPFEKSLARVLLSLPADRPLVLFGAVGGTTDPRKGADLLLEALQRLRTQVAGTPLERLALVVFGQSQPAQPPNLGFPIHYTGRLNDDISLRMVYSAADVFVIPSRQDNLPNTGLEAHACGTPVVAFRTGGMVDIVDDGVTGALAEPFDPDSLSYSIRLVLEAPDRELHLGAAARRRASLLWSPKRIASMYADQYHQMEPLA